MAMNEEADRLQQSVVPSQGSATAHETARVVHDAQTNSGGLQEGQHVSTETVVAENGPQNTVTQKPRVGTGAQSLSDRFKAALLIPVTVVISWAQGLTAEAPIVPPPERPAVVQAVKHGQPVQPLGKVVDAAQELDKGEAEKLKARATGEDTSSLAPSDPPAIVAPATSEQVENALQAEEVGRHAEDGLSNFSKVEVARMNGLTTGAGERSQLPSEPSAANTVLPDGATKSEGTGLHEAADNSGPGAEGSGPQHFSPARFKLADLTLPSSAAESSTSPTPRLGGAG